MVRKSNIIILLILFTGLKIYSQDYLNVMTFNIRYATSQDGQNAWSFRKDKVSSTILFNDIQLLGVQEALYEQVEDLQQRLPGFRYVGVGRDDGKNKGEFSAIFYDTTRLENLSSKTYWLSQTPEVPGSLGWDAAITRILTCARFRDKKTGKLFYAFNTHFDHMGKQARSESAKLIRKIVAEMAGTNPVIVTGDFNAGPADEPIRILMDPSDTNHFINALQISETTHFGPDGTFNGFGKQEASPFPIDHIFIRNGIRVLKHATISETWDGFFASDHFAVFARLIIP